MIVNYLLGGLTVWIVMGLVFQFHEVAVMGWAIDLTENILNLPWLIIGHILYYTIFYPVIYVWLFFRNAIKGMSKQAWEEVKSELRIVWKIGCFCLCRRHHTRRSYHRFFLVRIVEPEGKIVRTLQK